MEGAVRKTADGDMEIAVQTRLPHSVIQGMIEGLYQENSEALKRFMAIDYEIDETKVDRELRMLKNDLIKLFGILEYHAVSFGMPERDACVVAEHYMRLAELAGGAKELMRLSGEAYFAFREACLAGYRKRPRHNKIHNCMEFIENHTDRRFDLATLAELFGYNPSYLCQKFKAETGMTIRQYSLHCRLKEAAELLRLTNRTLGDIADSLCFSNQSHFQREFKKMYGTTPEEWRRRHRI